MTNWHLSDEFEMPLWVLDLDQALYSVEHRRLCVWFDELDARWHWELQTFDHDGIAASGHSDDAPCAKAAAEAAALRLSSSQGGAA